MKFLIVVEKTRTGFSAYSPDLDGCIATGRTQKQVEKAMHKAIQFHLEGMRSEGLAVPPARTYSVVMEVPA